jgi:hypothetical protein
VQRKRERGAGGKRNSEKDVGLGKKRSWAGRERRKGRKEGREEADSEE